MTSSLLARPMYAQANAFNDPAPKYRSACELDAQLRAHTYSRAQPPMHCGHCNGPATRCEEDAPSDPRKPDPPDTPEVRATRPRPHDERVSLEGKRKLASATTGSTPSLPWAITGQSREN